MIRKINQASLVKYWFRPKVWNLGTVDYGVSTRFENISNISPKTDCIPINSPLAFIRGAMGHLYIKILSIQIPDFPLLPE
jgi:hypothetical protein